MAPAGSPAAAWARRRIRGLCFAAEEDPEEVREPSGIAGAAELVADVAGLAGSRATGVLGERVAAAEPVAGRVGVDAGSSVCLPVLAETVVLAALLGVGE